MLSKSKSISGFEKTKFVTSLLKTFSKKDVHKKVMTYFMTIMVLCKFMPDKAKNINLEGMIKLAVEMIK